MMKILLLTVFLSTFFITDVVSTELFNNENLVKIRRNARALRRGVPTPYVGGEIEADDTKHTYGYTKANGPETWKHEYPVCGGKQQSPIALNLEIMKGAISAPLYWTSSFWVPPSDMTIRNSGHTVEISGDWSPNKAPELRGGPLTSGYTFWQMHYHWGMEDNKGSEHTVQNKSYPLEAHAVHYRTEYGSPKTALKYPDGLAVVGFIFQISKKAGSSISPIISALSSVKDIGTSSKIEPIALSNLLYPPKSYATYMGSLTTPPCSEVVTWFVSGSLCEISQDQLKVFRTLVSTDGSMGDNFRPPQPLNGRTVYYVS